MLYFNNDSTAIKKPQMQDTMQHSIQRTKFLFACGPKRYASQLKKGTMSANVTFNALFCMDTVEKFVLLNTVKSYQLKRISIFQ